MTPIELKEARIKLGLTQSQMAHVLGVVKRTYEYYETDDGKRPVHPTAQRAMQWFLDGFRPPEWPEDKR